MPKPTVRNPIFSLKKSMIVIEVSKSLPDLATPCDKEEKQLTKFRQVRDTLIEKITDLKARLSH